MDKIKQNILERVEEAKSLIPVHLEKDLPALDGYPLIPDWHDYESKIWRIGEEIRQLLNSHKNLRKDHQLQDAFLEVIMNRNAKRGRESFFFLVGYKSCNRCADEVAKQLDDSHVVGHAIIALRKMGNAEYVDQIRPLNDYHNTWIRNEAKKYLAKYDIGA